MAEASLDLIQAMVQRVLDGLADAETRLSRVEEQLALQGRIMLSFRRMITDAALTAMVDGRVTALAACGSRPEPP